MDGAIISRLISGFEVLQSTGAEDEDWALDRALHFEIAAASDNLRLKAEISRYGTLVQTMREVVGKRFCSVHSTSLEEHLKILHRLKSGDEAGAVEAMRRHLENARISALEEFSGSAV